MENRIIVYIINLKKDLDKREYMTILMDKFKLNFEFFKAVYGQELTENEICLTYDDTKTLENINRSLGKNEIGCAHSHIKVLENFVKSDYDYAIVLEDDIKFDERMIEFISHVDKLPKSLDVLLLGHHSINGRNIHTVYSFWYKYILSDNLILRKPTETSTGAYGYFITKNGAKKIIKNTKMITKPFDHYTGSNKYTNLYILENPIVAINEEMTQYSNLENDRKSSNLTRSTIFQSIVKTVIFYLKYVVKKIIYKRDKNE